MLEKNVVTYVIQIVMYSMFIMKISEDDAHNSESKIRRENYESVS